MIDGAYITKMLKISADNLESYEVFIPEAISIAEGITGRPLAFQQREEFLDGNGCDELNLPFYPVNNVVLNIDSYREFGDETLIDPVDFRVKEDSGIIALFSGVFPLSKGSIKVSFESGYTNPPDRMKEAVVEIVAWLKNRFGSYGDYIGYRDIGGDGLTANTELVPPLNAKRILEGFK